jgi:hypothetical protein
MSRWISEARPSAPRGFRSRVEPGSIAYSAVTHPWPVPRRKSGTLCATVAVHMTRVRPISMSTDPGAVFT